MEEGRSFAGIARTPGLKITAGHRAKARGAKTRVTLSLSFSGLLGPVLAGLSGGLSQRYLATDAKGLRERCDG